MSVAKNQLSIGHDIYSDISSFLHSSSSTQIVVFTQEKIQKVANELLDKIISSNGAKLVILDDGENSKDISSVMHSIDQLTQINADKNTMLISYGGVSVSDHVGFVASIFKI